MKRIRHFFGTMSLNCDKKWRNKTDCVIFVVKRLRIGLLKREVPQVLGGVGAGFAVAIVEEREGSERVEEPILSVPFEA